MIRIGKGEITVLGVILAVATASFKLWRQKNGYQERLNHVKGLLDTEREIRAAERMGRIRAEVKHCIKAQHDIFLQLDSRVDATARHKRYTWSLKRPDLT